VALDFDFRQLEAFCKVVELGGFSKAAKALNLAQASVSERIANLEEVADARLLDRLGRSVVPTKAGELLYPKAVDLLTRKRGVGFELQAFTGCLKGSIRIGGSTIPGNYILPRIMGEFSREYPGIIVDVTIGDSNGVAALVSDGVLELGFVGSVGNLSMLQYTRLWDDDLVLVAPESHHWISRARVKIRDLTTEPLIMREPGSGTQQTLTAELAGRLPGGIDSLNIACILGSSDAVKEGVKCGAGLAFISSRAVRTEIETGLLKVVEVEGLRLKRHFHLVTDSRRTCSPLCTTFKDFVYEGTP